MECRATLLNIHREIIVDREMIELSLILIDIFASSYPYRRGGARVIRFADTEIRLSPDSSAARSLLQPPLFCDFI